MASRRYSRVAGSLRARPFRVNAAAKTRHGRKGSSVRTIAIINQKGGCGKTTCSINLAAALADKGKRTLLVDMDPQSHCALGLAVPEAQIRLSTAELLRAGLDGSVAVPDAVWQIARNFDLIPSSMALAAIEAQLQHAPDKDRRLAQLLSTVDEQYDFCVIDCPPSIGLLTFNALRAAAEVIVPVETGYFSMKGAMKQHRTIEMLARRAGHDVRFNVLATMYDVRTKLAREILAEIKRHFAEQILPVVINFNAKLKEAASFGQPITEYDATSRGMKDFEDLVAWLLANPPATADETTAAAAGQNPAMSRAAELVERARMLSAKSAQLSAKLANDADVTAEDFAPAPTPQTTETPAPIASPIDHLAPAPATPASSAIPAPPTTPAEPAEPAPTVTVAAASTPPGPESELSQRIAELYGVRKTARGLLFVQPLNGARSVAIAGDFNGWNPEQTKLAADDNLKVWQTLVTVPPGRYRYRLVVDGQWVKDPYNQTVETNPFGELNNVIEVA